MKKMQDQFLILRELGRGGTSVVYLVADKEDHSLCAMKVLRRDDPDRTPQESRNLCGQLRAEAAVLRELGEEKEENENGRENLHESRCRAIPRYEGEVTDEKGDFSGFLMEYVEGRSLQELLEEGKVYSVREAAQAGLQLCGILARLHRCSPPMIYRDLKPANIMVRPDGTLALLDYGAVRKYRNSAASDTNRLGTEGYAAPEQYGGWEQSDERTDVYGIGAVLHHMITGRSPLETGLRPLSEILYQADRESAQGRKKAPFSVSYAQMGKILMHCCMTAPSMRYPSCGELEKELQDLLKICDREGTKKRFPGEIILLERLLRKAFSEKRIIAEKVSCLIRKAGKRYYLQICVSAAFLLCVIAAAMTRVGEEKQQYRSLIEKAQQISSAEKKEEAYRQAAALRPEASEAYICFARDLSGDNVITQKEKETLESLLYTTGNPDRMRESSPGEYARLQMELGKVYFACYEGGTEAAAVCFRNALESGGIRFGERKTAVGMTVVLGEDWTADRIDAWKMLVRESLREAEKTGDAVFAAAVCKAAAAETALYADRYEQAGAGESAIREVIENAERLLSEAESGKMLVPERSRQELATALESAARAEERYERGADGKTEEAQTGPPH